MSIKRLFICLIVCLVTSLAIISGSTISKGSGEGSNIIKQENREKKSNSSNHDDSSISSRQLDSSNSVSEQEYTNGTVEYKDGEYTGQAEGFRGRVKVSVVVKAGKISKIDILENQDDPEYFDRAVSIVDEIVANQTLNVDTVSGATFSSNGIIDAVNNALESAKK